MVLSPNSYYLSRTLLNLAQYFNITTPQNLSETIALQQVMGVSRALPSNGFAPPPEATMMIDYIINNSQGVYPIIKKVTNNDKNLLDKISENYLRANSATQNNLPKVLKIIYAGLENDVSSQQMRRLANQKK